MAWGPPLQKAEMSQPGCVLHETMTVLEDESSGELPLVSPPFPSQVEGKAEAKTSG